MILWRLRIRREREETLHIESQLGDLLVRGHRAPVEASSPFLLPQQFFHLKTDRQTDRQWDSEGDGGSEIQRPS